MALLAIAAASILIAIAKTEIKPNAITGYRLLIAAIALFLLAGISFAIVLSSRMIVKLNKCSTVVIQICARHRLLAYR